MSEIKTPGVYVEEVGGRAARIAGISTSTTALLGWTTTGPTDIAMPVRSVSEFEQIYGPPHRASWLGHAVRHFFENGGTNALVVRIAGPRGGELDTGTAGFEKALLGAGGLRLLDETGGFNLLCVPGESTPTVLLHLQRFCAERQAFLIADCAQRATVASLAAGPDPLLTGPDAASSAFYFPWIRAQDPASGKLRAFPPSGFVAGVYARTDAKRGVWKAPAGSEAVVIGARRPMVAISDAANGALNPLAINCIREFAGRGTLVWGARTLAGGDAAASEWKYVSIRRLFLFIEASIDRGTAWAVFEPNAEPLWLRLRSQVEGFLMDLYRQGAFQGTAPQQAYFVKCDATTTTQADIGAGIVNLLVGFAPLKPAEFVILRFALKAGQAAA